MAANLRCCISGRVWSIFRSRSTDTFILVMVLSVFTVAAKADNWTGAGQAPASQIRSWTVPSNWASGGVPPASDQNFFQGPFFNGTGDGTIELTVPQSAGAMRFGDFTYTTIAPGLGPSNLTMVSSNNGFTVFEMGEGVRDTYGVDYFTAGPQFTADVIFNNTTTNNVDVFLGNSLGNGSNSSMMFSGLINNQGPNRDTLTYTGYGKGTSLWISSINTFNNFITITPATPGVGVDGYTLHLVDSGRMNNSMLTLSSMECYLGLQDNTGGVYATHIDAYGSNIFTDRSYQQNDLDATINARQYQTNILTVHSSVNFGMPGGQSGRTNNGFGIRVQTLNWAGQTELPTINVNNGNLTEGRGGSRYISGANRLQEAHNYTYVDNLIEYPAPLHKHGTGVLAVDYVNNGQPGLQQWNSTPYVWDGVLRLGTRANPHNAPSVLVSSSAGLGIGWNTPIDLRGFWFGIPTPFPINWLGIGPGFLTPGQSGAVDIDLWGHNAGIIDTNNLDPFQNRYYVRVGSSMGGDATFAPQPNPAVHAMITPQTQIVPYIGQTAPIDVYYFGGGGGTLEVDTQLYDYFEGEQRTSWLEMGTTGALLPGRVALNPGGDLNDEEPNLYTGPTEICAGTLQLMKQNSVFGTTMVHVWTYDLNITNGLYANPGPFHHPLWEGSGSYSWTGPGQLLLDPGRDPLNPSPTDWSLTWYTANGGQPLFSPPINNNLQLDGGVIGWTGNVDLWYVPGNYGATITSNLNQLVSPQVNVLGLGGEYSAGTMTTWSQITDNISPEGKPTPVLLYKAGKNSTLDLSQYQSVSTYTGGTIIAGGEILVNNAYQLNAHEGNVNGGPIVILNGGRLHIARGGQDTNFSVPIMVNTDGTPDRIENCGSVIDVDGNVTATLWSNFDFSWNPTAYLEKDGPGVLAYSPWAPMVVGSNPANAWGLKLTAGLVEINQLPVNPGADSGPVIFNNGNLHVTPVPGNIGMLDHDPAYGFRNIVSMKGTISTVTVDDNAMFRTHGIVPSEILGTIKFVGNDADGLSSTNVIHLSRNMAPALNPIAPGDYTRGNGAMTFQDVTVYMSGGGLGNALNVLPHEAGFVLQLNDGVNFYANHQNSICGEVNFNNTTPAISSKWVRIDAEDTIPPTPIGIGGPPYNFILTPDVWQIYGTGYTTWSGTTEKIGSGRVFMDRQKGAPVSVNANTVLKIIGGTFEAGGSADPFTDTITNLSMDIVNDSIATGLLISQGIKNVDQIIGSGNTTVSGTVGTQLIATSIAQNTLTIGAGCVVTIRVIPGGPLAGGINLTPVPEPATWIMLVLAGLGLLIWRVHGR